MSQTIQKHSSMSILFLFGIIAGMCLTACQPSSATEKPVTLRIAVMPVIDTLPMHVADKEGLYQKHGVEVELIPVASAPERDQLMAAGQADGTMNEALTVAFFNKEKISAQVVRYARTATSENALFSILASPESEIEAVDELKGVQIGISEGTIIEYITDRLLQAEDFKQEEIQYVAVPKLDERMNLLLGGSLEAGVLPEPLTTLAKANGAKLILDDSSHPEYSFSTITFRKPVIDSNPEAVRSFLAAIEDAVGMINANPSNYEDLMVERKVVPPTLKGIFELPSFVTAGVPTEAQWNDMISLGSGERFAGKQGFL